MNTQHTCAARSPRKQRKNGSMRPDQNESHPTYIVAHPGAELFGSDRMTLESVRGLAATGARVVVALPNQGPLVSELLDAGAEVVCIPMLVLRKSLLKPRAWPRLLNNTVRGARAAWRLLGSQRPAAVYVSTITIPQWPILSRIRKVPVVSHIHEAEASGNHLVNKALYTPHLAAERVLINSAFSLDTVLHAVPQLAGRTSIVYNGVAGPDQEPRPRSHVDELRVLYVGRLSPRKGVDVALDAVAELQREGRPVRLTVLGSVFPGYEWYEQDLRSRAEDLDPGTVTFLGFKPDIWPVLAENDVLVVPSRFDEPFGNTAVEGILAGLAVIASDTSGLREAAGDYETAQLVEPGSVSALARSLRNVYDNWTRISRELASAAQKAQQRHDPSLYRQTVADAVASASRESTTK